MKFGIAFRQLRKQSGLTQKDISNFLGFNEVQMVSNVERGLCHFSKENLIRLCKKYKWNFKQLAYLVVEEKCQRIEDEWSK